MPRPLRDSLLVLSGIVATVLVQSGIPTVGKLLYDRDFKAAYIDCETAKANAVGFNRSTIGRDTYMRLRKTILVDEFRCLDSQALYNRLREFRVSDSAIDGIEVEAKLQAPQVTQ
jgi:hypothetical protein